MYNIIYKIINSRKIYNLAGPGRHLSPYWDSRLNKNIKNDILKIIDERNKIDSFYDRLEKDILLNGFNNPILVKSGFIDPGISYRLGDLQYNIDKLLICDKWGGSRLWVGQKYNLMIPCLILDFDKKFKETNLSDDEIKTYFKSDIKIKRYSNDIDIKLNKDF